MFETIVGNKTLASILEITFVLVMVYLVLSNAAGFAQVTRALGSVYAESVHALQGGK